MDFIQVAENRIIALSKITDVEIYYNKKMWKIVEVTTDIKTIYEVGTFHFHKPASENVKSIGIETTALTINFLQPLSDGDLTEVFTVFGNAAEQIWDYLMGHTVGITRFNE